VQQIIKLTKNTLNFRIAQLRETETLRRKIRYKITCRRKTPVFKYLQRKHNHEEDFVLFQQSVGDKIQCYSCKRYQQ